MRGQMPDPETERLFREILAGQARVETKVEGLEARVAEFKIDAKEAAVVGRQALDMAKALGQTLSDLNLPAQLEALRRQDQVAEAGWRSDLSNSYDRILIKLTEHDAADVKRFETFDKKFEGHASRIDALERVKDQQDGVKGFAGFIIKHGQLLLTIGIGFLAALGLKGHS